MTTPHASAGDVIAPQSEVVELRVRDLRQLFNAIDPSPFHDRDLDSNAEEYIVSRAQEVSASAPLGLMVYVDGSGGSSPDDSIVLRDAVQQFFSRRAEGSRRRLRELLRRGRICLAIGLVVLGGTSGLAQALGAMWADGGLGGILREGLIIGGWVAMWRPLEVFLYEWWPIRAEAKLYRRLAAMPVRMRYGVGV